MHFVKDFKKATASSRLEDLGIPPSHLLKLSQVEMSPSQSDGCGWLLFPFAGLGSSEAEGCILESCMHTLKGH